MLQDPWFLKDYLPHQKVVPTLVCRSLNGYEFVETKSRHGYGKVRSEALIWVCNWLKTLKGQCHEDFAVLGQFWAKIITLRLYS